jgi:hypothetical protein
MRIILGLLLCLLVAAGCSSPGAAQTSAAMNGKTTETAIASIQHGTGLPTALTLSDTAPASATPQPSSTPTITLTITLTLTLTATSSATSSPTVSATPVPSGTPTLTATSSATPFVLDAQVFINHGYHMIGGGGTYTNPEETLYISVWPDQSVLFNNKFYQPNAFKFGEIISELYPAEVAQAILQHIPNSIGPTQFLDVGGFAIRITHQNSDLTVWIVPGISTGDMKATIAAMGTGN